ncbi:MAG: hypothetical protein ACOCRK_04340 [bacterium]
MDELEKAIKKLNAKQSKKDIKANLNLIGGALSKMIKKKEIFGGRVDITKNGNNISYTVTYPGGVKSDQYKYFTYPVYINRYYDKESKNLQLLTFDILAKKIGMEAATEMFNTDPGNPEISKASIKAQEFIEKQNNIFRDKVKIFLTQLPVAQRLDTLNKIQSETPFLIVSDDNEKYPGYYHYGFHELLKFLNPENNFSGTQNINANRLFSEIFESNVDNMAPKILHLINLYNSGLIQDKKVKDYLTILKKLINHILDNKRNPFYKPLIKNVDMKIDDLKIKGYRESGAYNKYFKQILDRSSNPAKYIKDF